MIGNRSSEAPAAEVRLSSRPPRRCGAECPATGRGAVGRMGSMTSTFRVHWKDWAFRSQLPMPTRSSFELMVRNRTNELFYFNVIKLGPETPIAPGRGENRPFGERFRRSFRSRSPKCSAQPHGKLGLFQAVSPAESGSPLGWWRRIGNWERKLSVRREGGRWHRVNEGWPRVLKQVALTASGCDQARVRHRPRLLPDTGRSMSPPI